MARGIALSLEGLGVVIGRTDILRGIDIAFAPGAFNVIIGPNGAGKSTLLRAAAGLQPATSGRVTYDGQDVRNIEVGALARRRAVLSQAVEINLPISVGEVVLMGRYPHMATSPTHRDWEIVRQALDIVDMADWTTRQYQTLSGGERQKVHLARVLSQIWEDNADNETLLFLDEPTNSLDVHYQLQLLTHARDVLKRGCTVVATLHDLNLALEYADRLIVLDAGRVVHCSDRAQPIAIEVLERIFRVDIVALTDPGGQRLLRFYDKRKADGPNIEREL